MAAPAPADISDMPEPADIGLTPDPTADMPEPRELFKKATGTYPATQYALDQFMANPVNQGDYQPTARKAISQLSGVPRAAINFVGAPIAGGVSLGTHILGGVG